MHRLALVMLAVAALAQEPLRIVTEVRLVALDVAVLDEKGQPVAGLQRDAFRVYDNGRPRELTGFSSEDAPVTTGLVVDCSASMRARQPDLVTAVEAFVEAANPSDETFLVAFNNEVAVAPDAGPVAQALARVTMRGRTALYDALSAGLDRLRHGRKERKALVVLSDGGDNNSTLSRKDILEQVQNDLATLYTIAIQDKGQRGRDPGFLRQISELTGGLAIQNVKPEEMADACRRIAQSIRSRYVLTFPPAETTKPEKRKLRVEVTLPHGKATVLARPQYVALPPGS